MGCRMEGESPYRWGPTRVADILVRHLNGVSVVLLLITVLGSAVKELAPLPDSYFSDKRNFFNVFFVKQAWGWMLLLLTPLVATSQQPRRGATARLVVATAVWFVGTWLFIYIDTATGSCAAAPAACDRRECQRSGGTWDGVDISGHAFLLSYCVLLGIEELGACSAGTRGAGAASLEPRQRRGIREARAAPGVAAGRRVRAALSGCLLALLAVWVGMLVTTSLYHHEAWHKVAGGTAGLAAWMATYRWWYPRAGWSRAGGAQGRRNWRGD